MTDSALPSFVVESIFHVTGRGWVIARRGQASVAARDRGERFRSGDVIRCGHLVATVRGVETDLLPDDLESQGGLLLDVGEEHLRVGQLWVLERRKRPPPK